MSMKIKKVTTGDNHADNQTANNAGSITKKVKIHKLTQNEEQTGSQTANHTEEQTGNQITNYIEEQQELQESIEAIRQNLEEKKQELEAYRQEEERVNSDIISARQRQEQLNSEYDKIITLSQAPDEQVLLAAREYRERYFEICDRLKNAVSDVETDMKQANELNEGEFIDPAAFAPLAVDYDILYSKLIELHKKLSELSANATAGGDERTTELSKNKE